MNTQQHQSSRSFEGRRLSSRRQIGPLGTASRIIAGAAFISLGLLWGGEGVEWTALLLGALGLPLFFGLAHAARLAIDKSAIDVTGSVASCLNLAVVALLLVMPWTSEPTAVFLGISMLLAAWRGYAGCETLAISNWILRRDDQVGCVILTPIDELEGRLRRTPESTEAT